MIEHPELGLFINLIALSKVAYVQASCDTAVAESSVIEHPKLGLFINLMDVSSRVSLLWLHASLSGKIRIPMFFNPCMRLGSHWSSRCRQLSCIFFVCQLLIIKPSF